jgi:hypothetical protein
MLRSGVKRWPRSLVPLAAAFSVLCLEGCGTLYSEARDKQGEELKAAYAKVDLTAMIAGSRKNLVALLDEQLKLEDELWHQYGVTRAHLAATDWTAGKFRDNLKIRIAEIAGLGIDYSAVVKAKTLETQRTVTVGGEFKTARDELVRKEGELRRAREAVNTAETEAKTASEKYAALLKQTTTDPDHAKKVDEAKVSLKEKVDKLSKLQTGVGREFVSSAKVEALNEFLTTYDDIRAGKGAPVGSNRFAIALALFPDIADQVEKAQREADKPRLLALVMAKQVEQAKLAAARRDVARTEAQIELQKQRLAVIHEQLEDLNSALLGLGDAKVGGLPDSQPLHILLQPLKEGQALTPDVINPRIKAWRPLAIYLRADVNLRAKQNKLQYQIIALAYEEPLIYAESGLQQWKALLDPSVELLGAYGAAGLKAKDVQDFLNTLALLWIAAKVN